MHSFSCVNPYIKKMSLLPFTVKIIYLYHYFIPVFSMRTISFAVELTVTRVWAAYSLEE